MELLEDLAQIRLYGSVDGSTWLGEIIKRHRSYVARLGLSDLFVDKPTYI